MSLYMLPLLPASKRYYSLYSFSIYHLIPSHGVERLFEPLASFFCVRIRSLSFFFCFFVCLFCSCCNCFAITICTLKCNTHSVLLYFLFHFFLSVVCFCFPLSTSSLFLVFMYIVCLFLLFCNVCVSSPSLYDGY